jgi:hypothetical protein
MVVYQCATGTTYQKWGEGGPPGATYAATKTGWFNMEKFNQWFKQARVYQKSQLSLLISIIPVKKKEKIGTVQGP